MMDPRRIPFTRKAFDGDFILVGVQDAFAYENGQRTDVITGIKCNVVLPAYDYERLSIKLPVGTVVDANLIGQAVDFDGFMAKVYAINGKVGFSASATSVMAAAKNKA